MPRKSARQDDLEWELRALEHWKKKAQSVTSYEWDGTELIVHSPLGRETFDLDTVRAVIFNQFKDYDKNH